jgi:hypothetical protein
MKLSPSKNAEAIAKQYLKHEFRKIFNDLDEKTFRRLDRSIDNFLNREEESSFWNLLAGISEGWKIKYVFHNLSDAKYRWKLETIPVDKIILTGMSPTIDKYTIKKLDRDPLKFAAAWRADGLMRKEIKATGLAAHPERDHFPVLVYKEGDGYKVFDGMRRTLMALINGKKEIKVWAGYPANKKGKPLVSTNRCFFLANLYALSDKKDKKKIEAALLPIGRQIVKNFRNGDEVLAKRIAGWSHDKNIQRIFTKMSK